MMFPKSVVQRQLDAYNARDVDAPVAIYAADAQMFEHTAKLIARRTAALRERFLVRFKEPDLYAQLLNRVVMGNTVIDHERVTRTYEIRDGKIAKAWVIAGAATLDPGMKHD